MKRLIRRRPSAAMIVGVIALVIAMSGGAIAATQFSLSKLTTGAKNKTVGVGKLTYVTTTTNFGNTQTRVSAQCPSGYQVIGGGIKVADPASSSLSDSYPTTTGWTGRVAAATTGTATTTAICAKSRVVTGAPPSS